MTRETEGMADNLTGYWLREAIGDAPLETHALEGDARADVAILGGGLAGARAIWAWADLLNGIMAIPNLAALLALGGEVARQLPASGADASSAPGSATGSPMDSSSIS